MTGDYDKAAQAAFVDLQRTRKFYTLAVVFAFIAGLGLGFFLGRM
jgi:hypothetical protein